MKNKKLIIGNVDYTEQNKIVDEFNQKQKECGCCCHSGCSHAGDLGFKECVHCQQSESGDVWQELDKRFSYAFTETDFLKTYDVRKEILKDLKQFIQTNFISRKEVREAIGANNQISDKTSFGLIGNSFRNQLRSEIKKKLKL